ncbi:urease accessory protein UreF [Azospirillum sp. A39]|uniref:urease accessory protein UreF n=1 Tax=Azospirillum sp. A39 TaxID=3462279 RepID=UPI004045F4BD
MGGGPIHALLRLLAWLSPSFPTGAYTYSHGLEAAVEAGFVRDRASLADWAGFVLEHGAGRSDAVLFAAAHRAVTAADEAGFLWALERADALRGTRETALESAAQGTAFLGAVAAAWPVPDLERWRTLVAGSGRAPAHAVAVALCAALAGVPLGAALAGFLHAVVANLVSAGVRLVPLGQTDGQRALAALEPVVARHAAWAETASPDDLGSRAPMVDWTSTSHETQYTRLFRS